MQELFDAIPGHRYFFPYGFHFDVSSNGKELVYGSCEFPTTGEERNADRSEVDRSKFNYELTMINLDGTGQKRITVNRHVDQYPVWSPDGTRIAFLANPNGRRFSSGALALYTMAADGSDVRQIVTPEQVAIALAPLVWSPEGEKLAFQVIEGDAWPLTKALYTVSLENYELQKVAEDTVSEASWSPDSQRLTVARVEGDNVALFAHSADGSSEELITTITSREKFEHAYSRFRGSIQTVAWSPNGAQILYTCESGVCVVSLEDGQIVKLVKGLTAWGDEPFAAAWSPDGSRIAVFTPGFPDDNYPEDVIPLRLYTSNRDGSNPKGVVWLKKKRDDFGEVVAWNSPQARKEADESVCSSNTVIPKSVENAGLVEDCQTLLRLRDTLAGHATLNWNSETPITEWLGVTLGGVPRRVHELTLHESGLTGTLPPELGELSELRVLNLSNWAYGINLKTPNGLTGVIPPELAQLTKLEILYLHNNHLSGEIPTGFGNLTSLYVLQLQGNHLTGTIPPELGNLTNLSDLQLNWNYLRESIPPELGNLTNLWKLQLHGNYLTGNIPSALGNLVDLQLLNISNNQLTGNIPSELGALEELQALYLHENYLSGNIPPELGNLSQLSSLQLGGNNLSGSLPPELASLEKLRYVGTYIEGGLHLQGNDLSGCVPHELPDVWVEASGLERCAN